MMPAIRCAGLACAISAALLGPARAAPAGGLTVKPAFDCGAATGEIEALICRDEALARLDRKMAAVYQSATAAARRANDRTATVQHLKATQAGWIKGRSDCRQSSDRNACVRESYQWRIAELQARYRLLPGSRPKTFQCSERASDTVVATFYASDPPSARLQRGGSLAIGVLQPSGSGARYVAGSGVEFWTKGDDAMVEWPQSRQFTCRAGRS